MTGGGTGGGDADGGVACDLRETACPTGYECRETEPFEANCVLAFESLSLTVGDGGAAINSQNPSVQLQLVRKEGFELAVAPDDVNVVATGEDGGTTSSNVAGADGLYSGAVSFVNDGVFYFVGTASFINEDGGTDSLVSNRATMTVDTEPPVLTWQPLDAGQYKRDDIIEVKVDSNEPMSGVSAWLNGVQLTNSPTCAGATACFRANFSEPELPAMTATWQLTVAGTDLAGNVGDGGVPTQVTRVRWVTPVPGGELRASPAVGPDGTVYVGTTSAATTGTLARLSPASGAIVNSTTSYGGIVSVAVSPAATALRGGGVGNAIFVVSNTSAQGELRGLAADLSPDAGTTSFPGPAESNAGRKAWSGVALTKTAGDQVAAFATTNSGSSVIGTPNAARILKWDSVGGSVGTSDLPQNDAGAGIGNGGSPLEPIQVGSSGVPSAIPVVVSSASATFVTRQPSGIWGFPSEGLHLRKVSNLVGMPQLDGTVATLASTDAASTYGQAPVAGGTIVGTYPTPRKLHYSSSLVTTGEPAGSVDYGAASIGRNNLAFFGAGTKLVRVVATDPVTLGTELHSLVSGGIRLMPVLTKSVGTRPDTGYAITTTGNLVVFDSSPTAQAPAAHRWSSTIPGVSGSVETHMAFDCNRRTGAAIGSTGILYIPFLDGNVAAIVVDSPRLEDDPSSWPKYQRTMGNAGNDDTSFFPTNWNCP